LELRLKASLSRRNQLEEQARLEADESGGSKLREAKTIYKLKRADADKAQIELDKEKRKSEAILSLKRTEFD